MIAISEIEVVALNKLAKTADAFADTLTDRAAKIELIALVTALNDVCRRAYMDNAAEASGSDQPCA